MGTKKCSVICLLVNYIPYTNTFAIQLIYDYAIIPDGCIIFVCVCVVTPTYLYTYYAGIPLLQI